jgi:hypothetical protein
MGVERFAKGIAGQLRKANKPVMPSPCGTSWERAILTGPFDQQKFHKAIDRPLYCQKWSPRRAIGSTPHDVGTEHGQCVVQQLTGIVWHF